jgi:hypothetical protein
MSNNAISSPPHGLPGPLDDPFRGWPNSDLLIDAQDQAFFTRHFPAYAPIFDWPELRGLFGKYDEVAATARRHSRRSGVFAVVAGLLSLSIAATVPLVGELTKNDDVAATVPLVGELTKVAGVAATLQSVGEQAKKEDVDRQWTPAVVVGGIAAVLAMVSLFIGYTLVLTGRAKSQWLTNRFWTERIRQFHFQLIVNHLQAVIAAVDNKDHLQNWLDFRTTQLDQFNHDYLRGAEDKIHHLELDEAEDSPWIVAEWERPGPIPAASPELDVLLKLMERQRFGIQERYAERKLRHGLHSPATLADWVLRLSDTLTFLLLLATITAGAGSVLVIFGHGSLLIHFIAALVAAIASAIVVALRALKEGLLFNADTERYRWYLAAVRTLYRRYEHADLPRRVFLLRELERTAYQEMRRFMLSAANARFVM